MKYIHKGHVYTIYDTQIYMCHVSKKNCTNQTEQNIFVQYLFKK